MIDYVGMLREFHEAFGHHVNPVPHAFPSKDVRELRIRLIEEEADETCTAMEDLDLIEIADGLADLLYVTFGAALAYGIPIDLVFAAVHKSNMAKLGPDGKPMKDAGGKTIKPAGWVPPTEDIKAILQTAKRA